MKLLRDKKELTRFLILYHSALERPTKLSDLSGPLDMTEQGVSNYISEMEEQGLLDATGKRYHPTPKGMELVREVLTKLNSFVDEANRRMDLIKFCTAIADQPIDTGDELGLYMSGGFLRAGHKKRSSTGVALNSVKAGEPVSVGRLRGITDMEVGTIYMLKAGINSSAHDVKVKIASVEYDLLAVTGEAQYGLVRSLGLEPEIIYASRDASVNAAERGLNTLLVISDKEAESMADHLDRLNREREEEYSIPYTIL